MIYSLAYLSLQDWIVKFPFLSFFIISTFRLTNKVKRVVAVNQKCLSISVPPVSILPQLTKIHFTVINAGSAGKLGIYMVLVQWVNYIQKTIYISRTKIRKLKKGILPGCGLFGICCNSHLTLFKSERRGQKWPGWPWPLIIFSHQLANIWFTRI